MQKFVVKKISRSTNITISAEDQELPSDENLEVSSVKMCGYLKKKRNFGGWTKLYFVLQNSLLMSYNSKQEYEKKLVSFKDVICLIPGNTVLLPSLEPRFTIASNLNTFYTFRCDDNKTCSKWITAILECLSRDITTEFTGKKSTSSAKSFFSQQNLSSRSRTKCLNGCQASANSWENIQGANTNWIVNHNGRILLELNYMNCNRAKLPIASKTAKILKNCTDNDVIRTTKKINFIHNDENKNVIHNGNGPQQHNGVREAHDTQHSEKPDQFRLHNDNALKKQQSREVNRIKKMFPVPAESESKCPENLTQPNGTEIGTEEQEQCLSFDEEYSIFNSTDYVSVDSTRFNQKLNIENTYSEVGPQTERYTINGSEYAVPKKLTSKKWIQSQEPQSTPEYSVVDLTKKYQERLKKLKSEKKSLSEEKLSTLIKNLNIYEDIESAKNSSKHDETNIYELIEIPPLKPSKRSRSALVWKNWSRMHLNFDFAKRFNGNGTESSSSSTLSADTIRKRQRYSLTLKNFKHFNYRSMREKARKFCRKSNSTSIIESASKKVNE